MRIPEIDFAGIIDSSSEFCGTIYKPGDAVYGHILPSHHIKTGKGALCEYVAVSPRWICKQPDRLSFPEAAALPTAGISAYKLLLRVPEGAKVFVNGGSGGVGSLLLQLLKHVKRARVVPTASEESSALLLDRLGVEEIVNYRSVGPLGEHLAANYGRHFDVCIDLIGDVQLYKASDSYMKPSGIYLAFGGGLSSASFLSLCTWLLRTLLVGYWSRWLGTSTPSSPVSP